MQIIEKKQLCKNRHIVLYNKSSLTSVASAAVGIKTYVRGTTPAKCVRNSQVLQVDGGKGCVHNNVVGVYMGEHKEGGDRSSEGE